MNEVHILLCLQGISCRKIPLRRGKVHIVSGIEYCFLYL